MPGFAGFISNAPVGKLEQVAETMLATMRHESFYQSGKLTVEALGLGLGWVAHPGSFAANFPVWNARRDVCLLFSGEEFTEPAEQERLQKASQLPEGSRGGYLLQRYEEKGEKFFETLNGDFCGLLIDLRERKVILFNDRFGLGRVYFHQAADGCYFASEAKALLKARPELARLDWTGFAELFSMGCVLQDRTIFQGISILPPGSAWTIQPGREIGKRNYFDRGPWESRPALSTEDYYQQLKATWQRILPRYFRSGEKMAMSLTGGLDSRIIMAWTKCEPGQLPCYSHRGPFNECADARIARRIARLCDQPFRTLTVGQDDFFSQFGDLASQAIYITDGMMDVSGAAGLFMNRKAAREIAPVRMTGNYGSEILRRNVAFKPRRLNRSLFSSDFNTQLQGAAAAYQAEKACHELSFIAFKQVPWHHHTRYSLEQSQVTVRSPYLDNELVALAYEAPAGLTNNQHLARRLIEDGNPSLATFPTDRGPLGRQGVFGRIAEQYHEFTFKAEYAYDYGMPQKLARFDSAFGFLQLERLFLGRHKYYHYRTWYRHQLAAYVKQVLLDPRSLSRPWLNRQRVEQVVQAHVSGRGNYTSEIHMLLTGELISRQLLEAA